METLHEREGEAEGDHDSEESDADGLPSYAEQVGGLGLEADHEEKEDDAEFGEDVVKLGVGDEAEEVTANDGPGDDLADDLGLSETAEELTADLRGREEKEQVPEYASRLRHGDLL
jgi:hypothetical protein